MVYHLIFDISVNFDDAKKADHILKSSQDIQSFDETLFVIYKLSETEDDCQVVSSHGYWDPLYYSRSQPKIFII